MPDEKGVIDDKSKDEDAKDENFIGTFKDKEAAEQGWANLEGKLKDQGTELGGLRKQVEFSQQMIEDMKVQTTKAAPVPEAPTYDKDIAAVQKEMAKLDSANENYNKDMLFLMNKSNTLSRKAQHEETMAAATSAFKKELDERDVQATHNAFYKENPTFNTPEMQMRIKEYIANDQTGMSDPLVAYREIQRDDASGKATQLEGENVELKRLVELAKGTDATGKVITKGQSTTQQQTKQPKTTGADRDEGMQAALDALRT